jgi:predicted HNH restriction endonuclease
LVVWTSKGISQNSTDSVTCIPNSQLRRAINIIENGKVVKQELELSKERYVVLEYRIATKDSIISQYINKDNNWRKIDENHKKQIINYEDYTKNTQRIFKEQRKRIRGLKFKKWAGILAGFGIGYVIAK